MTDPAGGPPAPQGSGNWQTPPPPAPGGFQPGNFQPAPVAAGPAPGVVYADLMARIFAAVIDGVILWVVWAVVAGVVLGSLLLSSGFGMVLVVGVVLGVIWAVGTAAYFVYTWTTMRASPGQKILKLETVSAADGATLTRDQAIKRWAFLFGPTAAATVLSNILGLVGSLLGLLALGYIIYLAYTISQDAKRQGFHDVQAGTVVVKRLA
ncbi:MAG: RDD family protein [Chloroflexota bacterium]|nr:RDD family protein [Chloroflexota bacterium]